MTRNRAQWSTWCLILLSAIVVSSARGKTIDGQVFIVTAAGPAIKLALVQVGMFAQSDIEQHIRETDVTLSSQQAKADAAVAEATKELQKAKRAIAGGYAAWVMSHEFTPAEARADALKYDAAKQRVPKAEEHLAETLLRQKIFRSAAPYFVDLPTPTATAKTDADGRFQLNIPGRRRLRFARDFDPCGVQHYGEIFLDRALKAAGFKGDIVERQSHVIVGSPDSILTTKESKLSSARLYGMNYDSLSISKSEDRTIFHRKVFGRS